MTVFRPAPQAHIVVRSAMPGSTEAASGCQTDKIGPPPPSSVMTVGVAEGLA